MSVRQFSSISQLWFNFSCKLVLPLGPFILIEICKMFIPFEMIIKIECSKREVPFLKYSQENIKIFLSVKIKIIKFYPKIVNRCNALFVSFLKHDTTLVNWCNQSVLVRKLTGNQSIAVYADLLQILMIRVLRVDLWDIYSLTI